MNKALAKSASAGLSASDMSACRERLESLRDDIDNQRRIAMEERTDEVKKYPSGGALEYLLDEGKVSAVRKTIFRQALTGPNIPLGKQDFMDEILCDIEGAETWEVHAHFRDKNARLRNATAIHVRARGGDKDVRPPVTVALLERLENLAAG